MNPPDPDVASPPSSRTKVVLTPVDFSNVTDRVLREATALARMLRGRVTLVHVTEPTTGVVDYAAIVVAVAQVNEAAVKHAIQRLAELEQQVRNEGVPADSIHLTGTPVSEIIEQARKLPADYIVIGSHGHTAFYDLLVGGTAHGVLKRAACPVVIVPPRAPENETSG
jgi:nucleotide-binding universal stress UspA family protein